MQERLLHGLPFRRVIRGNAVGAMKQNGAVRMPAVYVFRSENAAVGSHFAARKSLFLDDYAESIAGPRIGVKIQIPAENFRQAHRQLRLLSRVQHRAEKR